MGNTIISRTEDVPSVLHAPHWVEVPHNPAGEHKRPKSHPTSQNVNTWRPQALSDTILESRIVLFQQGNEVAQHCMLYDSGVSHANKRDGLHEPALLGELIFGPMPMRLNVHTTKIHLLTSSRQCLLTKLFQIKVPAKSVHSLLHTNAPDSSDDTTKITTTTTEDSDAISMHSTLSSSNSSPRQGHYICRGSFALGCILTFNAPLPDLTHTHTSNTHTPDTNDSTAALLRRQNDIQRIVFSHFACIELRLSNAMQHCYHALQLACTKRMAALADNAELHRIFQGYAFQMRFPPKALQKNSSVQRTVKDLQRFLHTFLLAPRLEHNLWLEACHSPSQRTSLFQTFLTNLKALHFNHIDTLKDVIPKSSNITSSFQRKTPHHDKARVVNHVRLFMTSVLSAVLMHHTSWTSPFAHHLSQHQQCSATQHNSLPPLSIQLLCSFYGANPQQKRKKFTRVIVVGTNTSFVRELLTVLSYVLRCEKIVEKEYIIPPTTSSAFVKPRTTRASSFSNRSTLLTHFPSPSQGSPLVHESMMDNMASSADSISSIMEHLGRDQLAANGAPSPTVGIPRVNNMASSFSTTPMASPSLNNIVQTSVGSFSPSPPARVPFANRNFLSPSSHHSVSMISPINLIELSPIPPASRTRSNSASKVGRKLQFDAPSPSLRVTTTQDTNVTTVPIPHFTHASNKDAPNAHKGLKRKFGHALFADVCPSYGGSFVLSGLSKEVDFIEEAINDLKLVLKMKHAGDVEAASEAACIVVDTDSFLCNVIVARRKQKPLHAEPSIKFQEVESSEFLKDTLKQLDLLHSLNMSSDTMCDYFEDRLEELCITSAALKQLLLERRDQFNEKRLQSPKGTVEKISFSVKKEDIARSLGVKTSDIPLLEAVLQAHDGGDSVLKHISSGKVTKPKRRKRSMKM